MAGEISGALVSIRAALEIAKAMIGLRDAEAFRTRSVELQGLMLETLEKAVAAREAESVHLDRICALEAEVTDLKNWNIEKANYELKSIGPGAVAHMLKRDKRGAEPPHWLCPNCYAKGQKSFLIRTKSYMGSHTCLCSTCSTQFEAYDLPHWQD